MVEMDCLHNFQYFTNNNSTEGKEKEIKTKYDEAESYIY